MTKRLRISNKDLISEAIRQNVVKKDLDRLYVATAEAEKVGVGKSLRRKGLIALGQLEAERGNHPAAILALNSARVLDTRPESTLLHMFDELDAFCQDFAGRFSRQDLSMLSQALERLESYHSHHHKVLAGVHERLDGIRHWIEDQLKEAVEKEETPASHHVQRIYAALYPPMTAEEVRAEFARLVEPFFRERLEHEAQPAAGGGGEGPKDPDEPAEEPSPPPENGPSGKKIRKKGKKRTK